MRNLLDAGGDLRIIFDRQRPLASTLDVGHTRWHPEIPPIARLKPGDDVVADVRDGGDAQMWTAPENRSDINRLHPLTGPFYVTGAEPGDLLTVEILAIEPDDFGWTAIRKSGKGLMRASVEEDFITTWRLAEGVARSADIPGVAIPAAPFLGIVGVAPAPERMKHVKQREAAVNHAGGWALMPGPEGAIPSGTAEDGLRTMPPREIGGNLDVKDLASGASITLPVDVEGALLSLGDPHFSQGDGESFGTAIEMSARVGFRCRLLKAADLRWRPRFPFIEAPAASTVRRSCPELITTGMSIDEAGRESYLDVALATRQALTEMTSHLVAERGFTLGQAQAIVSVAVDLRISVVNNPPTIVVTAALPLDIFETAAEAAS
jgi:formamidase